MTKILVDKAVIEQALEALTNCCSTHGHRCNRCDSEVDEGGNVAAALSAALEQHQVEQEPVAWIEHEWSGSGLRHLHFERPAPTVRDEVVRPVWTPLYLHPQPPRQPLTRKDIAFIAAACGGLASDFVVSVARAIEAAHGVKGRK